MKTSFDRARWSCWGCCWPCSASACGPTTASAVRCARSAPPGLTTLLNTQVGTLEQWVAERRHEAEQLAADPDLGASAAAACAGARRRPRPDCPRVLDRAASIGITAVLLIAPDGASWRPARRSASAAGQRRFPGPHAKRAARQIGLRPTPRRGAGRASRSRLDGHAGPACGWPRGRRAGAGLAGRQGLGDLFSAARLAQSGEALAFDTEGWLLSPSRHAAELEQRGLAPRLAAAGRRAGHAAGGRRLPPQGRRAATACCWTPMRAISGAR
jgi:hypothetical protein